jgi:hypothetical protein
MLNFLSAKDKKFYELRKKKEPSYSGIFQVELELQFIYHLNLPTKIKGRMYKKLQEMGTIDF